MEKFDWIFYVNYYNDLNHITNYKDAIHHYNNYGKYENRIPYFDSNFDYNDYKIKYSDLKHLNKYELWAHYFNYGKYENRLYISKNINQKPCIKNNSNDEVIVISFHVGDINVFTDIITKYNIFFKRSDIKVFITIHNETYKKIIKSYLNNVEISIIDNIGCDIGGLLYNLTKIINTSYYDKIKYLYVIHTKTDSKWRNDLLEPLLLNYKILENKLSNFDDKVTIAGANDYIYPNIKGINGNKIKTLLNKIIDENNINISQSKLNSVFLKYYDNFYDDIKENIQLNTKFYKFIEHDLRNYSNNSLIEHWYNYGTTEYHRLNTPDIIKENGNDTYFVAGTIFIINKLYLDLFKKMKIKTLLTEFLNCESGYIKNYIETDTHKWEYFFGIIPYLLSGNIFGIKDCNNSIILNNEFPTLQNIIKKTAVINNNIMKARVAIFLLVPVDNLSGGYRTLLKYIHILTSNNIYVDIYLGHDINSINTDDYGYDNINVNIDTIINILNSYNEIDINKYNVYMGFNCRRKYDILLANAWQVADAVYLNKHYTKHLGYIIQDLEYLFYDNELNLTDKIINTYKIDYNYYCLSNYLSINFNKYSNNIYKSYLGVDINTYSNINLERENSVILAYYKEKKGRHPETIEKIINKLIHSNIKCYVFPDNYDINNNNINYNNSDNSYIYNHNNNLKENLINLGHLTVGQLNDYYNKSKVGIIFSGSNPSRLGFEMYASGLKVIEYDSEFTKYDLPNDKFIKIKTSDNIVNIVNNLFKTEYKQDLEYVNLLNLENELNNFYNYINILL